MFIISGGPLPLDTHSVSIMEKFAIVMSVVCINRRKCFQMKWAVQAVRGTIPCSDSHQPRPLCPASTRILEGAHGFVINNPIFNGSDHPPRERPGEPWVNVVCCPN